MDRNTGTAIRDLDGHTDSVVSVTFSPDGQHVASASFDGTIKVWDVQTGTQLRNFDRDTRELISFDGIQSCLRFSDDGKQILSIVPGAPTVEVWDASTGQNLLTLMQPLKDVLGDAKLRLSFNGQRLVTWEDDVAVIVDTKTGNEIQTIETGSIHCLCMSPDGELIAAAGHAKPINIFSTTTGKLLTSIEVPGTVDSLCFNSDSTSLCSAVSDAVFVWNTRDGSLAWELGADPSSPKITDESDSINVSFGGSLARFSNAILAPDGSAVIAVAGGSDELPGNVMMLWNQERSVALHGHSKSINAVAFSRDSRKIISGSSDHTVKIWDSETGVLLRTIEGHNGAVMKVALTADEITILSLNEHGQMTAWDVATGREMTQVSRVFDLNHPGKRLDDLATFSGNGLVYAAKNHEVIVERWDVNTGERLRTDDNKPEDTTVQFDWDASRRQSADGRYLLLTSQEDLLLIDQAFFNSPSERAYRKFKAKPKLWWHAEQAQESELSNDWFAAAFHRGWILKSQPESSTAQQLFASAHNRLLATDPELAIALTKRLGLTATMTPKGSASNHSQAPAGDSPEPAPPVGPPKIAPVPIVDPSL